MNNPLILELQLHEYLREQLLKEVSEIDEHTLNDTLEGLTSLHEKLSAVIRSQQDDRVMSKALKERIGEMQERLKRFEHNTVKKRELVTNVMERADIKKIAEPDFTASLRPTPPTLVVTNESVIPEEFWNPQAPRLDRQNLIAHFKSSKTIPGATLDNGGITVSIRTR